MRILQPPTTSGLTADADIDMLTLYQLKRLAAPASGEALRKGNPDITDTEVDDAAAIAYWKLALTGGITNDDIASDAAIAISKLASTPILESLLTTRGDIIYRGALAAARLPKGTEGQYLQQGANDPQWATVSGIPTIVRKTADEAVNNSSTLQNDDHLLLAIAANEVWVVEAILYYLSAGVTPDLKVAWALPAGATGFYLGWGLGYTDAAYISTTISTDFLTFGTGATARIAIVKLLAINGATAGNIQLKWAQGTPVAEDTKVLANSCLIAHKLA